MSLFFFNFFIKFINLIPINFFIFIFKSSIHFIKYEDLFNILRYESEYKNDNFSLFFLPLFINIYLISNDIQQIINKKKVVSIVTILIFSTANNKGDYVHTLPNSNNLYTSDNFNDWISILLVDLVKKLELYHSFEKVTLVVKVKVITKL